MNICVRSNVSILLCLIGWAALAAGQGTRIRSDYGPLTSSGRDMLLKRELWFRQGRTLPGQSSRLFATALTGKKCA